MILLQKVAPRCCEVGSWQHGVTEGNHDAHIPLSSNARSWLAALLQKSRQASYSLAVTDRLTRE